MLLYVILAPARFGCKGKSKYWYGYKRHVSVDMGSGLINKIAITPANVSDSAGVKHVCPTSGAVLGDKAYGVGPAKRIIKAKGCHSAAILKNNMKEKNKNLDSWRTKMRAPHESVFSKMNHRARYKGVRKNQFAAFFDGLTFKLTYSP
jgi:IS5 family transposase